MNVLCVDSGNTRIKWGLRERDGWSAQGVLSSSSSVTLAVDAKRMVACNVAGDRGRQLIETLAAELAVPLDWLRASNGCCGVRNEYRPPEQLGADRWAALIGAHALHSGPALVVMSGTATTVDVLDRNGVFRGGLILPGLSLMREALAAGTADLPICPGEYRDFPNNTFDAIASGAINATLGAMERMFRRLTAERGEALCLVSGGAASALASHLSLPHRRVDNLVLEGLARFAMED